MTPNGIPDDIDHDIDDGAATPVAAPRRAPGDPRDPRGPGVARVRRWRLAPEAWRLAARLTPAQLDRYLRLRTARALPRSFRARFAAMQIPNETVERVLGEIRSLDRWMDAWNQAAQRFLTEARREGKIGGWREAAEAQVSAAMCFHAAHLVTDPDPRTLRTLRASSVTTFAQAVPKLFPETHKIGLRWRTRRLPAYLSLPLAGEAPFPLLVMLNGATTCKEELLLWSGPILEAGIAVLALDWPGTGEAASIGPPEPECDDITDAVVELAAEDPDLDPERIALLGFSLGGTIALRAAALDRRVAGAIAVTPPYDPAAWWRYVNPLVRQQLLSMTTNPAAERDALAAFSLRGELDRLRCPILLFGAGRDLVVPPEETLLIAADAGELATVCWYPTGSHGLYTEIPDWTALAARWVNGLFDRTPPPPPAEMFDPPPPPEASSPAHPEGTAAPPVPDGWLDDELESAPDDRDGGVLTTDADALDVGRPPDGVAAALGQDAGDDESVSAGTTSPPRSTRVDSSRRPVSDIWDDE